MMDSSFKKEVMNMSFRDTSVYNIAWANDINSYSCIQIFIEIYAQDFQNGARSAKLCIPISVTQNDILFDQDFCCYHKC